MVVMENRKLFAFDLDGTLLTSNKEVDGKSKEIKDLITKIKELGHVPVVLTGRRLEHASHLYDYFGFDTIIASNNGAFISHPKDNEFKSEALFLGEGIADKMMKDEKVKAIIDDVIIHYPSTIYSLQKPGTFVSTFFENSNMDVEFKKYTDGTELKYGVFSILFEINEENVDKAPKLVEHLKENYSDQLEIITFRTFHGSAMIIEVVDKKSRKDYALEKIAKFYNISIDNTIAFGDGGNDLHMLKRANIGIAMANARDVVKEAANGVTKHISNEFGVLRYIEDNDLI